MGGGCAEPPESSTSGGLEMISGGRGGGATPCGMWDLSSPTRDCEPILLALGTWSLNHWTTREVPGADSCPGFKR